VHAHWERGGLAVIARHCCGPARGSGRPSPTGPPLTPARGRGRFNPIGAPYVAILGPLVTVPPEEEVPQAPPVAVPPEEEEVPASLVAVLSEGRRCLVPVPPLVSSSPFFFSKTQDILLALFSYKRGRFVG
jgi:hypothetical protein